MGYACPVCEAPQRDGEHLANHLAFTAMLRGGEHEAWLDERVEGWGELNPADLAEAVTTHAEEAEYEEVFDDTARDHSRPEDVDVDATTPTGGRDLVDAATEEVLREARELTREMQGEDDAEDGDQDAEGTDADADEQDGAGEESGDDTAEDEGKDP